MSGAECWTMSGEGDRAGPRRRLRRGPASRVGGKLAIASSAQPRRENHVAEFVKRRVITAPDYPDSRIFQAGWGFCRRKVSAEMTDAELKVGLAFHGISCIAAFAVLLLYMRLKAEET